MTIGAVAGALYSLIIPFVLRALGAQGGARSGAQFGANVAPDSTASVLGMAEGTGAAMFFLVCLLILCAKALSVILVNNIAKSAMAELRLEIARKINQMRIADVESVGFPRLLNVLIDDVNTVAAAAVAIPMVVVSAVTVVGMLGYLATMNFTVFVIVLTAIGVGVAMFQLPVAFATRPYDQARSLRDVLQEGIRGLIMGVYELKLDRPKSRAYLQQALAVPQRQSVRLEKLGDAVIHLAGTSSDLLAFFIIGLIVFVMPRYIPIPAVENYGVVMALLYIAAPVASILGMMQHLRMGQVAIVRIHRLDAMEEESHAATAAILPPWRQFSVREVSYRYPGQEPAAADPGFALSPTTLSFEPGQINFIVGGNGSGKSTLSKLISLHYQSATGAVYFDDAPLAAGQIDQARARIGVIFSNYYLFNQLYRSHTAADLENITTWLRTLRLQDKTCFVDGRFTTTKLSDGQRRRLALLVALLEDKDIYVFDEWAADQDPEFKQVFYREILPAMKSNNKLVIVITHDDRYFDCADRLIFMEEGRVVREQFQRAVNGAPTSSGAAIAA
ncbi:cyclic peptide export ABC transporter [Janthinobacterium sp. ROICE36]|uniref:cyclic peptide export ABC transporter n=1 Tax=Janthinobacterium sp. ROICE36 TaxID=2048670 RepID=UPI0015E11D2F|nr:cyclic peptide export ABC transporter [Janthinobacterium sp. ROICE36]